MRNKNWENVANVALYKRDLVDLLKLLKLLCKGTWFAYKLSCKGEAAGHAGHRCQDGSMLGHPRCVLSFSVGLNSLDQGLETGIG